MCFTLIFAVVFLIGVVSSSVIFFLNNSNPPTHDLSTGLHVVGNKIVTGNDATLILHGVDYTNFIDGPQGSWMLPNGDTEYSVWDIAALNSNLDAIKSWGFNNIRVLATTQWWTQNTANFRSNLQYFITQAALRGLTIDFTFWRNNGSSVQTSLPYPPYDDGNGVVNSVNDFVNLWGNVANVLKGYPNVMFELWNEPNGDEAAQASWFNVTQQCIDAIRGTGASNIIVVQWGSSTYLDFLNYSKTLFSCQSVAWAFSNSLHDPKNNIVYSTHLYSNSFYDSIDDYNSKYSYSDMLWALNVTGLLALASEHPVWIGEIGCNLWDSNMDNEYAWYNNTLTILNQYSIGYSAWAWAPWKTGTQWGIVTGDSNYQPNQAGQILQQKLSS